MAKVLFPTARQYNPASLSTSHRESSGYRRVREYDENTHKKGVSVRQKRSVQ